MNSKVLQIFCLFSFASITLNAQQTLTESMGAPVNGATIAAHETANGFDQDALTYSGTGDMRTTSVSSGYVGASGGGNVMFNNTGESFIIGGLIPNGSCTSIDLSFGVRKNTNAESGSLFNIEYSTTGASGPWTSAGSITLPTGSGTTGWYLRSLTGLPGDVLAIRFSVGTITANTDYFRVDDISVIGNGTGCLLPVNLISFSVKSDEKSNIISFKTASEINNSHFEIERSTDGVTFNKIGEVKGAGNSIEVLGYSFEDKFPRKGTNYYRLRQVDTDGTSTVSPVRSVVFGATKAVTVFPTPATDQLNIELDETFDGDANWQILDMMGKVMAEGVIPAEQKVCTLPVAMLVAGNYVLRVSHQQATVTKQFSKN